ncbi:hypothetical protein NitYY0918_C1166 [Nitratiruptor sp. YY09-18]|nr:hypothetical protein NitYY0918_C1166 [Nitratiruptor sp. YY09-18]
MKIFKSYPFSFNYMQRRLKSALDEGSIETKMQKTALAKWSKIV